MNSKSNKFGFTLIELLGVLIILAIIALITFPIIDNVLTNSREQAYQRSVDGILEASRMYVTSQGIVPDTNTKRLNLQTLINSGFLEDKDVIDPRNNESMTGCVMYRWDSSTNQYKYEYNEECIITTEEQYFTYRDVNFIESFDINYDNCLVYMKVNFDYDFTDEEWDSFCKGNEVHEESFADLLNSLSPDSSVLADLKNNSVVTNLVSKIAVVITGYDNRGGVDVIVPKQLDGKDVVGIGVAAFGTTPEPEKNEIIESNPQFLDNSLLINKVSLINSIDFSQATELIYIMPCAFRQNNLTKVIFNDNIQYIGEEAFAYNHLQNLSLPNSIEDIGKEAFIDNLLTSVSLPNSINIINDGLFENNQLSNIVIPNTVQEIGYSAFEGNNLTSLVIPDSVYRIDSSAFSHNNLTNLTLSKSLSSLEDHTFSYNQLQTINLPENIEMLDVTTFIGNPFYDNNQDEFFVINNILIKYNGTAKDIIIPSGIKAIAGSLFEECELTSVTFPDGLEVIGDYSFNNNSLTNLVIPDSVISIGYRSFSENQIASLELGDSLKTIEYAAFEKNKLTSVIIPDQVLRIDGFAFSDNNLTTVTIGKSVNYIEQRAFNKFFDSFFGLQSNKNLSKIINKTGRAFDWGPILELVDSGTYYFETGTVVTKAGTVEVTK